MKADIYEKNSIKKWYLYFIFRIKLVWISTQFVDYFIYSNEKTHFPMNSLCFNFDFVIREFCFQIHNENSFKFLVILENGLNFNSLCRSLIPVIFISNESFANYFVQFKSAQIIIEMKNNALCSKSGATWFVEFKNIAKFAINKSQFKGIHIFVCYLH